MSDYKKKAKELSDLLLSSVEAQMYNNAKRALMRNEEAEERLKEYYDIKEQVESNIFDGSYDDDEAEEANEILTKLYKDLKKDSSIGPLLYAQQQYNELVYEVIDILKNTLF